MVLGAFGVVVGAFGIILDTFVLGGDTGRNIILKLKFGEPQVTKSSQKYC